MAFLEVHLPDGRIERMEISKPNVTLGRAPEADLRINDPEVSRLHARLDKMTNNRWIVTDLDSKNETYFQGRAIKSHTLTHLDTFFFGSIQIVFQDPSGGSDKKIDKTLYKDTSGQELPEEQEQAPTPAPEVQKPKATKPRMPKGVMLEPPAAAKKTPVPGTTPIEKKYACPLCKADMSTTDIVCTRCGYNLRTGEAMKVEVEEEEDIGLEESDSGVTPEADLDFDEEDSSNASTTAESVVSQRIKRKSEAEFASTPPIFVSKRWQMFMDWWLPIGVFVLAVLLILGIQKPAAQAGITLLSVIFRTVLMLFTLAIATKVANFQLGYFFDALVKVLAITSVISLFELPNFVFGIVASLVILVGLIKLFFNPDLFGWLLSSIIMFVLNTFLIAHFMLPQLRALFK
jgi:pSer/pThr/pTyr-binding forkhead associated (FHA) protein